MRAGGLEVGQGTGETSGNAAIYGRIHGLTGEVWSTAERTTPLRLRPGRDTPNP